MPQSTLSKLTPILFLALLLGAALMASVFLTDQESRVRQAKPSPDALALAQSFAPVHTLEAKTARFCAWSDDGDVVSTVGQLTPTQNDSLQHWDVASGTLISTSLPYCSPGRQITSVAVLSNTIGIVEVRTGRTLRQLDVRVPPLETVDSQGITSTIEYLSGGANSLLWSKDGRELVTATTGSTGVGSDFSSVVSVQLWDVATGIRQSYVNIPDLPFVLEQYLVSPDLATIAAGYVQYGPNSTGLKVDLWDLPSGTRTGQVSLPLYSSEPLFWSSDSRTLAVLNDGRQVTLIDAATAKVTRHLPEVLLPLYTPTPDPHPRPIGTMPGTLAPLPESTAQNAVPLPVPSVAPPGYIPPITPVALLPEADPYDYQYINNIVWSPDGSTLATYDRSYLRFWDVSTGAPKAIARHPAAFCDRTWPMSWSPDGRLFATIDCEPAANVLRFWDGTTAAPLGELTTNAHDFHWSLSKTHLTLLIERIEPATTELWAAPDL